MKLPSNVYAFCPVCEDATMNHILRGSVSSRRKPHIEAVVECLECSHVYHTKIELEQKIQVPLILSKGSVSRKLTLPLAEDDVVSVGDELFFEGERVKVTSIEHDARRVPASPAAEIATIWAKYHEKVPVKVSVVAKGKTYSRKIWAAPEEEFEVGDIIEMSAGSCVIYSIKTNERNLRRGYAKAEDILRVYTKPMKSSHRRRG